MADYSPVKLIEYVRDGLIEQEHFGVIVRTSFDGEVKKTGDDKNYPFFLRSCAKPLQAALLIDFGIDKIYNMTDKEIAVCCASHTGEPCHTEVVKGLLKKIGLDESYLKCGLHKPLSKTEQNKLIKEGLTENVLQNNCSGKHAMMLAICKAKNWGVNDYYKAAHPLQIAIKEKINQICEVKQDYPVTKDGCGVPIYSMPLENMVRGYMNLFLSEKYSKIKDAFVKNPYLIGGEDRLDTAIMEVSGEDAKMQRCKDAEQISSLLTAHCSPSSHVSRLTSHLIAKVGAGGLIIVINLEKKEGIILKIMDCDMKARAIVILEALKQLGWLSAKMLEHDLINAQNKTDILTLHGEKMGVGVTLFTF